MTGFFCVVERLFRENGHLVVLVIGFGHTPLDPLLFRQKYLYIYKNKFSLYR
jgi:hypothetical protein